MSAHTKPNVPSQPIVDEWGFYDPDQAGLAAVLDKLAARPPAAPSAQDAAAIAASMREARKLQDK